MGLLNLKVSQARTPSDVSGELVRSCVSFVLDVLSTIAAAAAAVTADRVGEGEQEQEDDEEEEQRDDEEEGQGDILFEVESLIEVAMQCNKDGVWNIATFGVADEAHRKFILASLIQCLHSLGEVQRGN